MLPPPPSRPRQFSPGRLQLPTQPAAHTLTSQTLTLYTQAACKREGDAIYPPSETERQDEGGQLPELNPDATNQKRPAPALSLSLHTTMGLHHRHAPPAPPDPASAAAFVGLRPYKALIPAFQAASVLLTFVGPLLAPNLWLPFVSAFLCAFLAASALQVRRMAAFVLTLRRTLAAHGLPAGIPLRRAATAMALDRGPSAASLQAVAARAAALPGGSSSSGSGSEEGPGPGPGPAGRRPPRGPSNLGGLTRPSSAVSVKAGGGEEDAAEAGLLSLHVPGVGSEAQALPSSSAPAPPSPPSPFTHHGFIIPNYGEPTRVLRSTLSALATHPGARGRYAVMLAMEGAEAGCEAKAAGLVAEFGPAFADLAWSVHTLAPGESPGKAANVNSAARALVARATTGGDGGVGLGSGPSVATPSSLCLTVMDADAQVAPLYIASLDAAAAASPDPASRIYAAPILFERNAGAVPVFTRVHDAMWAAMAAQNLASSTGIGFPISNYSLSAALAVRVGWWDTHADAIGEDLHMFVKCFFATHGAVRLAPLLGAPSNMLNLQASSYGGTLWARAVQAERHARGVADFAYAAAAAVRGWRRLPVWPTCVLLAKLLEAQLLPSVAPLYMGLAGGVAVGMVRVGAVSPDAYGPAATAALARIPWLGGAGAAAFLAMATLNEAARAAARARLFRLAPQPRWRVVEYGALLVDVWAFMVLPSLWAGARSGLGLDAGAYVVAAKEEEGGGGGGDDSAGEDEEVGVGGAEVGAGVVPVQAKLGVQLTTAGKLGGPAGGAGAGAAAVAAAPAWRVG